MELFSVTLLKSERHYTHLLRDFFCKELNQVPERSFSLKVELAHYEEHTVVRCTGDVKVTSLSETMEYVRYRLSSALAAYMMESYEIRWIDYLMMEHYFYRDPKETEKIRKYAIQLLDEGNFAEPSPEYRNHRQNKLFNRFYQYFSQHTSMILEGFIRFRMSDYLDDLKEVVEHAIDEYVMDQEYQEFISLLKYFVLVQDPKMKEVHVYHTSMGFELMHANFTPVQMSDIDWFMGDLEEQDIKFEDMIVSTLISASPEKVIIHTQEAENNVVRTIRNIFDGRAVLCSKCEKCLEFRNEEVSTSGKKTFQSIDFS